MKKILLIALIDSIFTQVFINIIPGFFRFSLAVAILPVFYYFDEELNPLITAVFISIFGVTFRTLINLNTTISTIDFFYQDLNIVVFDLVYGLIFYLFYYKKDKGKIKIFNWAVIVFLGDLIANIAEIISRQMIVTQHLNELILVAFLRSVISIFLVFIVFYVKGIINKEFDRKRYNELLGIFSGIQAEVYLMKNNIKYIENVMTDAYMLYDNIEKNDFKKNKKKSLKIAQNVHELKKNYIEILNGLSKVHFKKDYYNEITMYEILDILRQKVSQQKKENKKRLHFLINKDENFVIKKHFLLMSVLRNLIDNSLEALFESDKKRLYLNLSYHIEKDNIYFTIKDNGIGIKDKNIDYIFNSGFSTKFTKSGEIHRGVGLTLTKQIIEKEFQGEISIDTEYKKYTKFNLKLKKNLIEEGMIYNI